MKLHPRYFKVKEAEIEMRNAIYAIVEKYELTGFEMMRFFACQCETWATQELRLERHGTYDKKADEE